jgi:hypothetical protein
LLLLLLLGLLPRLGVLPAISVCAALKSKNYQTAEKMG